MLFMKMEDNWNASVVNQYMQLCFQIEAVLKHSLQEGRSSVELSGSNC